MAQKVIIERNLAGLEDLLFGTGVVTQSRGGKDVPVTRINAKNLPFDETRSLSQAIIDLGNYSAHLAQYGQGILDLQANLPTIVDLQTNLPIIIDLQTTLATDGVTAANSLKLGGQTPEQIMANINSLQDTQTAVLGTEIWGNSIRQQGLQFGGTIL